MSEKQQAHNQSANGGDDRPSDVQGVVIRAFRVSAHGTSAITFALTRGSARWACVRGARDAGFQTKFGDVSVKRAPEYDNREMDNGKIPLIGSLHNPEYLKRKSV